MRLLRPLLLGPAVAASLLIAAPASAAGAPGADPCDQVALPQCVAALGPVRNVTGTSAYYQPALIQLVPISDYVNDPEDSPPPLGAGTCGNETSRGPSPAPGRIVRVPPHGVPAPPGSHGPYCLLSYLSTDFTPLCSGCVRALVDYGEIPAGTSSSPGGEGHWAARINQTAGSMSTPYNGHSPNVKNLCSDKFFNPSSGSGCDVLAGADEYGLGVEGDSRWFHHYPVEGRYYNGPYYLAGDGARVPYHWVHGFYVDLSLSGPAGIWYSAGYRGRGDASADTDQSYACLCEAPPFGHQAMSPSYPMP
jgi:hypothetical protein